MHIDFSVEIQALLPKLEAARREVTLIEGQISAFQMMINRINADQVEQAKKTPLPAEVPDCLPPAI